MSPRLATAFPWLLGLAWGAIASAPLITQACRSRSVSRVDLLRVERQQPERRAPVACLRQVLHSVPWGPVGRIACDVRARRRTRREQTRISIELPVTLDLLAVAVDAGCTPYLAVEVAARWTPPAMTERLTEVLHTCSLGSAFADALDGLADRVPRLRGLVDALLTSERLGAPVGPALARLAAEERAELRRRAEAHARTVPVRLLFPLVFLVLPAFVLLTVVPALLTGFARS